MRKKRMRSLWVYSNLFVSIYVMCLTRYQCTLFDKQRLATGCWLSVDGCRDIRCQRGIQTFICSDVFQRFKMKAVVRSLLSSAHIQTNPAESTVFTLRGGINKYEWNFRVCVDKSNLKIERTNTKLRRYSLFAKILVFLVKSLFKFIFIEYRTTWYWRRSVL